MQQEPADVSQQSLEERLEGLPVDERQKIESSWKALEELTPEVELPEGVTVSRVEFATEEEKKERIAEMQAFLKKAFSGAEMMDEMQMEISLSHNIVDYHAGS